MTRESKPKLAAKARLRFDRIDKAYLLLYPERGLKLTDSAARIVGLCDGERTVAEIAEELARAHGEDVARVEADVMTLLARLAERGLVA